MRLAWLEASLASANPFYAIASRTIIVFILELSSKQLEGRTKAIGPSPTPHQLGTQHDSGCHDQIMVSKEALVLFRYFVTSITN